MSETIQQTASNKDKIKTAVANAAQAEKSKVSVVLSTVSRRRLLSGTQVDVEIAVDNVQEASQLQGSISTSKLEAALQQQGFAGSITMTKPPIVQDQLEAMSPEESESAQSQSSASQGIDWILLCSIAGPVGLCAIITIATFVYQRHKRRHAELSEFAPAPIVPNESGLSDRAAQSSAHAPQAGTNLMAPILGGASEGNVPMQQPLQKLEVLVTQAGSLEGQLVEEGVAQPLRPQQGMATSVLGDRESAARCLSRQIPYSELLHATQGFDPANKIGQGGFGSVFRGRWKHVHVAIKRLEQAEELAQAHGMSSAQQLLNEVRVMSKFQHPNILQILGFCVEGPALCLVYPLAEKGSLYSVLHEAPRSGARPLSGKARMRVFYDVVCGLAYLHGAGEIHRDIKSANILLDKFGTARIGDFGLARTTTVPQGATTAVTIKTQIIVGSTVYMAPEVHRAGSYSELADVYATGVVALELLTSLDASPAPGRSDLVSHLEDACSEAPEGLRKYLAEVWAKEEGEAWMVLCRVAAGCMESSKSRRPKSAAIVEVLERECAAVLQPDAESSLSDQTDVSECVICTELPPVVAFVPCGHRCLCEACTQNYRHNLSICPVCRTAAADLIRVFT